jgi:hypothetical protein
LENPKWDNAIDEEMATLDVNATWDLIALLKDKKTIGCKWVYKVKHNARWICEQIQSKISCQSYAQSYGIDYEKTYSPIAKMITIKTQSLL